MFPQESGAAPADPPRPSWEVFEAPAGKRWVEVPLGKTELLICICMDSDLCISYIYILIAKCHKYTTQCMHSCNMHPSPSFVAPTGSMPICAFDDSHQATGPLAKPSQHFQNVTSAPNALVQLCQLFESYFENNMFLQPTGFGDHSTRPRSKLKIPWLILKCLINSQHLKGLELKAPWASAVWYSPLSYFFCNPMQ